MAARRPFWKWQRWKSIGFCLWPPSTCIWNLKLKFQSKLDLCSGNHVVYRQTDGRTDGQGESSIPPPPPPPPPSNFVGRGYNNFKISFFLWYLTGWTPFHWMKLPRAMRMPRHHNWHRLIHCNPLSKEWWDDPWGSPCNYLADRDRDLRKSAM